MVDSASKTGKLQVSQSCSARKLEHAHNEGTQELA